MESSFWWPDSQSSQFDDKSFIISDSENEDIVGDFNKEPVLIDDSNGDCTDELENSIASTKDQFNNNLSIQPEEKIKVAFKKNGIISSDDDIVSETDDEHTSDSNEDYISSESDSEDEDHETFISSSLIRKKGKKRKDVTHDNTREDIKELKPNNSSESLNKTESFHNHDTHEQNNDTNHKTLDLKYEASHDESMTIVLDSDSHSGGNSESELAISMAKEEVGVENMDPLIAQKRAIIVCKLQQLKNQLASTERLLTEGHIEVLPDKGEKLHQAVLKQKKEIEKLTLELENMPLIQDSNIKEIIGKKEEEPVKPNQLFTKDESKSDLTDYSQISPEDFSYSDVDNMSMKSTPFLKSKELGKIAQATMNKELSLTIERLQDLHGSLVTRPSEDEKIEDPRGLKVSLMPHQQHAIAWLLWREQQRPSGGVLADDMGLGKTLTMISLIMITLTEKNRDKNYDSEDSDSEWNNKRLRHNGGTLVVCPASLLSQWEKEVQDKCKRGLLSVEVYHGSNRESVPKRLGKNDIVITTYNIAAREYKSNSTLYKIHWKRVILDEAHIIRNHKSQASQAVCGLLANKRWALTGTPIQNKEMDLYSILKFLKCSPFDDIRVWKRWVDNKNAAGHQRLATVMKTLMLRRTKQELQSQGRLESLPEKFIEEITVKLDSQEQLVYEKILIYSRTLFAQFLAQRAEKEHMIDLHAGKYSVPTFVSNPNKETQFTKAQKKLLALHADVKTHEILVLLLRLRQICCHPALIHAMLDQEDMKESGIIDTENVTPQLLSQLNNISLNESENHDNSAEDLGINRGIIANLLTAENPVFDDDRVSSKMKALLDMIREILQTNDKMIIVSQWTSMLEVIALNLRSIKGATFDMFTGNVAIKNRQNVMDSFNSSNSGPRILLLSLTAGGVGLNLVGGNRLLLFDIHWNPQLETQAQDRIYRFGQKKNVYIYKFICANTIEERIKTLQERKLEIAQNVLSGDRSNAATKLTLNDLKSLFAL